MKNNFILSHTAIYILALLVSINNFANDFNEFKKTLDHDQLKIVFATQFISNPASVMGHTFILFANNKKPIQLWQTLNFSADIPENTSAFSYIFKGITGGFNGVFKIGPFYEKTKEYERMEQRGLWIYDLNLTKEQRDKFIEILYNEINYNKYKYYFFTQNCSYILLQILEKAIENKDKLTKFYLPYITPIDTIKKLKKYNLISNHTYRQSLQESVLSYFNDLNNEEKKSYFKIRNDQLNQKQLDLKIEMLTLKKERKKGILNRKDEDELSLVLEKRAEMQTISKTIIPKSPIEPFLSDDTNHLELGYGKQHLLSEFVDLSYRPGVYNNFDFQAGHVPHSSVNLLETNFRYFNQTKNLLIKKFVFIDLANTPTWTKIDPLYTWRINLNLNRNGYANCLNCMFTNLYIDYGLTLNHELFSTLFTLNAHEEISKHLSSKQRLFIGPNLEIFRENNLYKISTGYRFKKNASNSTNLIRSELFLKSRFYRLTKKIDLGGEYFVGKWNNNISPDYNFILNTIINF